jgi:hypothetical protein
MPHQFLERDQLIGMLVVAQEWRPSNNEPRSRSQLFLVDRAVQT